MRADDDVDRPVGQPVDDDRLLLGRRPKPREQPDLEREGAEALAERRLVLRGRTVVGTSTATCLPSCAP